MDAALNRTAARLASGQIAPDVPSSHRGVASYILAAVFLRPQRDQSLLGLSVVLNPAADDLGAVSLVTTPLRPAVRVW